MKRKFKLNLKITNKNDHISIIFMNVSLKFIYSYSITLLYILQSTLYIKYALYNEINLFMLSYILWHLYHYFAKLSSNWKFKFKLN